MGHPAVDLKTMYLLRTEEELEVMTKTPAPGIVNYSLLTKLERQIPFKGFSIKYVGSGSEQYVLNGRRYSVSGGEYVLANRHCDGQVLIDARAAVQGLCIDLNQEVLQSAIESYSTSNAILEKEVMRSFFDSTAYFENRYRDRENVLGDFLRKLNHSLHMDPRRAWEFDTEFFLQLAEVIVWDHAPRVKHLSAIGSRNDQVRKDIYRKLINAREFMDDMFSEKLSVAHIAEASCMSEFHFYRLFKKVFQQSPHQYLLKKRIEHGDTLVRKRGFSISEAALLSGFADVHAFSKAYKKFYGVAPSHIHA